MYQEGVIDMLIAGGELQPAIDIEGVNRRQMVTHQALGQCQLLKPGCLGIDDFVLIQEVVESLLPSRPLDGQHQQYPRSQYVCRQ